MAGEWLKLECSTPDKPEVFAITAAMGWDDPDTTVGKLFRLWRWFDQQTTDGNARGVTSALLDRIVGVSGFAHAMQSVGWLVINDAGVSLPNFEKHNGATAKGRAQTAKRVANHRSNAPTVTPTVTPPLAREEKRREEVIPPALPDGFAEFYEKYPKKVGKPAALKAFRSARVNGHLPELLADIESRITGGEWAPEKQQFIPNPATYLNQRRWEDEKAEPVNQFAGAI